MGEDLRFGEETIHHSIALFDRFFSMPQITEILGGLSFSRGKTLEQIIQLVAVICMLISSKFLEKTYPGV